MSRVSRDTSQFLCVFFLAIFSSTLLSQSQSLVFNQTSLDEVIKTIEEKSGYVFNYEPALLKGYNFSGRVDTRKLKDALTSVLYDSPCSFEVDQNTVLVYRADPKTYRICGTVNGYAKEPLIAANIAAIQLNVGGQSDEFGGFDFELTADKNQRVEISYLGYQPTSFVVQELREDDCPSYELKIDQDIWTKEIVIKDYILDGILEGNEFGGFELAFDKLSQNHSNVEHDILKTAQLLPGINSIDDSATNLQIRGSSPGQNLILWEGAPVYNAGHIFGMISAVNPFSVNEVNIYKGAHDPRYDNRVGGIIDISLTDSIDNVFHGSIGTTLTEVHANLAIPVIDDRLSLVLSGRQSIEGIYNSPPLQSYLDKVFQFSLIADQAEFPELESLNTEQTLDYKDWNAKLLYRASDRLSVSLGTYSNQQDFKYAFSFDGDPFLSEDNIKVNTEIISANIDLELNDKWTGLLSFYSSSYRNEYDIQESEIGLLTKTSKQLNVVEDNSFTFSNVFRPSLDLNFTAGYEFSSKSVFLDPGEDVNFDPDFVAESNERAGFHNLFLSANYTNKKIRLDAGARMTYYQEYSKWAYSPRFNFQYSISKKWKFKVDGGIYHQFISQVRNFGGRQIIVDNPLWILNTSDTQLSQRANKLAAGFVFRDKGWLVDVDTYYNHTVGLSTVTPSFGLLSEYTGFSKGSSTAIGADILVKKKWSAFSAWVNYSLGFNKNNFPVISEALFFSPNDIRHNISIISSYKVKNVQFSLNANYHSGLPYSRPNLVLNEEDESPEPPFLFFLEYEQFNNNRLKPYLRFDLNVNYRFGFKGHDNLKSEISLSFINLLNTNNIVSREYELGYNDDTLIYSVAYIQKVLLDRTPLLLFRLYW